MHFSALKSFNIFLSSRTLESNVEYFFNFMIILKFEKTRSNLIGSGSVIFTDQYSTKLEGFDQETEQTELFSPGA